MKSKYYIIMEDWNGARIHFEGTYKECVNILWGMYNEIVEFRAVMPMEEWTPILYIEGQNTLIIGGNKLKVYTIYSNLIDAERRCKALNDGGEYLS